MFCQLSNWAQIARDYGEQCADTDGLAASAPYAALDAAASEMLPALNAQISEMHALIDKLFSRAERAEANLATAIRERDALRVELDQRMALPARALRFSA